MQIYRDVNLITLNRLCPVEYSSPAITKSLSFAECKERLEEGSRKFEEVLAKYVKGNSFMYVITEVFAWN